ncbi:hemerythrin domain-containing protein [bacterium]|nr:MAG: hemerythrin domain-containing protein [bacterium]
MSQLIDELEKEHVFIAELLTKAKKAGVTSKDGLDQLLSAKVMLLTHLKKEDTKLYPILKSAAERNKDLQQTLDLFAKDMNETSKAAVQFFEKYSRGGEGNEFARDFGRLYSTLQTRMRKEENTLYKEYIKLNP